MSLRGAQRRGNLYPRWQPIIDRHASLAMTNQGNPRLLHCVRNDKGRKVRNDKGGKVRNDNPPSHREEQRPCHCEERSDAAISTRGGNQQ